MSPSTASAEPRGRPWRRLRLALDIGGWVNWCGSIPVLLVTTFNDAGAAPPGWFPNVFVTPALWLIVVNLYLFPLAFVILVVVARVVSALEQNPRYSSRALRALHHGRDLLRGWSALAGLGTAYLFAYMGLAIAVAK